MKIRDKQISILTLALSLSLLIGCRIYKTDPLGYDGKVEFHRKAKVTKSRGEITSDYDGRDTIYTGIIKTSTSTSKWSVYEYKTRIMTNENGSFYLLEFTNLNSKLADGVWYDRSKNELLIAQIGIPIKMHAKFSNGKFSKELLAQVFFAWLNASYYN